MTVAHPYQAAFQGLVQDNGLFALTTTRVEGRDQVIFRHGPRTLPELFRKVMRARHAPFLLNDHGCTDYETLFRQANACAALLSSRGIRQGMRVRLELAGDLDWIAAFVAVTSLGAIAVLDGGALACDAMIADRGTFQRPNIVVTASELADAPFAVPEPALSDLDPEMGACIAFTSGSSGAPKAVLLTHRGLTTGLMNMMLAGAMAAEGARRPMSKPLTPSVLLRTPLSHVSGYMQILLMFTLGGRVVRSGRKDLCGLIAEHQLTSVTGICDEEIGQLLQVPAGQDINPLRSIAVVGRALPASLRHAVRERWPDLGLGSGYGLTETNGLVCAIGSQQLDMRPRAVGHVLPTAECRIADADGQSCAPGEQGEIWLRGAMLMRGYCNLPDHRMPGGWLATGDVGFLTEDGMLHVLGKDDRFLRAGRARISCRDIEDAVREACGPAEVAALPLRASQAEDGLLIVLADARPGAAAGLKDLLSERFPTVPEPRFVTRKSLPRTGSGKIAYARLLAEAQP